MRNSRQKFREITRFVSPVSLTRAVHCMFYSVWSLLHIFPNFLIVFDIKIDSIPNTLFFFFCQDRSLASVLVDCKVFIMN